MNVAIGFGQLIRSLRIVRSDVLHSSRVTRKTSSQPSMGIIGDRMVTVSGAVIPGSPQASRCQPVGFARIDCAG
jgi:hypothetical protein